MELSQSFTATLTHYSTEPLTTGPDYDPLFLLLSLAGDVHSKPGSPRYPCSVCFKNITSQCTSYLCTGCLHWVHQDVLVFETFWFIVEPMAGYVPPVGRHQSLAHLPRCLVPPTMSVKTSTYYSGTPMVSATNRRN